MVLRNRTQSRTTPCQPVVFAVAIANPCPVHGLFALHLIAEVSFYSSIAMYTQPPANLFGCKRFFNIRDAKAACLRLIFAAWLLSVFFNVDFKIYLLSFFSHAVDSNQLGKTGADMLYKIFSFSSFFYADVRLLTSNLDFFVICNARVCH